MCKLHNDRHKWCVFYYNLVLLKTLHIYPSTESQHFVVPRLCTGSALITTLPDNQFLAFRCQCTSVYTCMLKKLWSWRFYLVSSNNSVLWLWEFYTQEILASNCLFSHQKLCNELVVLNFFLLCSIHSSLNSHKKLHWEFKIQEYFTIQQPFEQCHIHKVCTTLHWLKLWKEVFALLCTGPIYIEDTLASVTALLNLPQGMDV